MASWAVAFWLQWKSLLSDVWWRCTGCDGARRAWLTTASAFAGICCCCLRWKTARNLHALVGNVARVAAHEDATLQGGRAEGGEDDAPASCEPSTLCEGEAGRRGVG